MALNIHNNPYGFGSGGFGVGGFSGRNAQPAEVDAESATAQQNPSIGSQALASLGLNIDQFKVGGAEANPFAGGGVSAGGQYGVAATQGAKAAIPSQNAVYNSDNQSLAQKLANPNGIQYQSPDISNNGINDNWMKNYYA